VNEFGVPISCACCEKLGDKFHLPRNTGVKKSDPVDVAMAEDVEKEQGLLDALSDIETSEYDYQESGAAGGGDTPYCVVIEQAVKTAVKRVVDEGPVTVTERLPGSLFVNIPAAVDTSDIDSKLTFIQAEPGVVERDNVPDFTPSTPESLVSDDDAYGPITKLTLDDFLDELSVWNNSPRSIATGDTTEKPFSSNYQDLPEARLIMVNTILPDYKTLSARVMLFLTHLVASTDLTPMTIVPRVDRRAVLTTSMTATVDNFLLRLIFPAKWTWKEVTYEDYDLMVKKFYNATVTRDVFPKLYDIGVSHFAFIPIGQYDSTKQVYSYFLARVVTGMEEMLSPAEKEYYSAAPRVQTTMNTFLAISNVLVMYHYQLIKAIGAH